MKYLCKNVNFQTSTIPRFIESMIQIRDKYSTNAMTRLQFPRKPHRRDLHHSDYSIMRPCFTLLHSVWIIKSFNLFITILFTFIWIIKLIRKNSNNSYPRVPGSDGYTDTHFFMVQLIMTHWNNRRKQQGLRFN